AGAMKLWHMLAALLLAVVAGAVAFVMANPVQAAERCGVASFYSDAHHGKTMANGEPFNMHAMTAAMWGPEFGTRFRVTHGDKSVVVTITDRGPAKRLNRVIDLSLGAFERLAHRDVGLIKVCLERL